MVHWTSVLQLSGREAPDIHCSDALGNTPLHCAAYRGQEQCVIKLLKSGASPNMNNNNGLSLIMFFNVNEKIFVNIYCLMSQIRRRWTWFILMT